MKAILALLFGLAAAVELPAETVEIIAGADTTLREGVPADNFGGDPLLLAGAAKNEPETRLLLRFNIGRAVPPGATIVAARLTLQANEEPAASSDEAAALEIRRVLRFWNEGDGASPDGTAPEPQEATWNSRAHPDARWTRPGGAPAIDFARRPSGALAVGESSIDSTPAIVADVQDWLDRPHTNDGWVLSQRAGSPLGSVRSFASREDSARAPRLTVEFAPALTESIEPAVEYNVVFRATWSSATHPRDFPANAHWSRLVGGLHNHLVSFWGRGATASEGIQRMAERGAQSTLLGEVDAAISAGTANGTLAGSGIARGSGSTSLRFRVESSHPLVTLVSMVAPSPDWFVGVRGLPLLEKGRWVARKSVTLFPYDAGTDSGATFLAADEVTQPRGVITRIITSPLARRGWAPRMGTFIFTRVAPESTQ